MEVPASPRLPLIWMPSSRKGFCGIHPAAMYSWFPKAMSTGYIWTGNIPFEHGDVFVPDRDSPPFRAHFSKGRFFDETVAAMHR
ncbi:hypothetical protein GL297_07480 [Komagataeibacter sp. FXV2]|nr:hypothetical protein [Komagataeibacter sp. FXV2]